MGREHAVDHAGGRPEPRLPDYLRLEGGSGAVVCCAPALERRGREMLSHLDAGLAALPEILALPAPRFETLVVADEDWEQAPRDSARPYPVGLPYFTRASSPPALVTPAELSWVIRPRTEATLPLAVGHELAHAFLAGEVPERIPAWLRELPPQAASAAVCRREGLPLEEHLSLVQRPGFTIQGFSTPARAEDQMAFQNLLLKLGAAALEDFGEGFLRRLVSSLRREVELDEPRSEEILAAALGDGGREWLDAREDF